MDEKRPDNISHEDPNIWALEIRRKLNNAKKTLKISKRSPQDHSSEIKEVLPIMLKKELIQLCTKFGVDFHKSWSNDRLKKSIEGFLDCCDSELVKPKFIDLFCGMGSFHHSFGKLGMQCVMASDIDKHAKRIYEENYGLKPMGDIVKIDPKKLPPCDIACAGFSCQPFSNIGQHKGFKDKKRGTMFHQIMKFADAHHPKLMVL